MCLEERKWAYELEKRYISKFDQIKMVKNYKKTFPQSKYIHSHILQVVADDIDKAFKSFFRRVKNSEKAGYPRFKSSKDFHSFGLRGYKNGYRFDSNYLKLWGIGEIHIRLHRPIPIDGKIKTVRIIHKAGQWFAAFAVELPDQPALPKTGKVIGIDMGISALITDSDGNKIENPNYYREAQKKLRVLQRSLSRKQKDSNQYKKALLRVQKQQIHVANQRSDYIHKLTTDLVRKFDGVALEDLNTKGMVKNHHMSKSILDSGWGIFKQYLTYKAESAGREIKFVDPAYTSQTCPRCGKVEKIGLATRWIDCECGMSLDRDHRAAICILTKSNLNS